MNDMTTLQLNPGLLTLENLQALHAGGLTLTRSEEHTSELQSQ